MKPSPSRVAPTGSASPPRHARARRAGRFALQAALLVGLSVVTLRWATPLYNWDLLPYIAAADRFGGASDEAAHADAYDVIRATLPARDVELMTASNAYRRALTEDPSAFAEQLPFYTVKPAYPLLMLQLRRIGLNPVDASLLISRVSYIAVGMLLLAWLGSFLAPLPALATAWALVNAPFVIELARLSTPDALSAALILGALVVICRTGSFRIGLGLLLLSLFVRPDNVLWLLAVAAWAAVSGRRTPAVFAALAGIVICALLMRLAGHPGWTILFHHSFVASLVHPLTFQPTSGALDYVRTYLRQSHPAHLPLLMIPWSLITVWLARARWRRSGTADDGFRLLLVAGGFVLAHWAIFPGDDRFLVPAYLATLVVLIRTLAREPATGKFQAQPRHPVREDS